MVDDNEMENGEEKTADDCDLHLMYAHFHAECVREKEPPAN